VPAGFNVASYLSLNTDVAAVFSSDATGAWQQFWNFGLDQGRVFDNVFRVDEYVELYGDLKAAIGDDRHAGLMHWLNYGRNEGRMGRVPPPFNADLYIASNPDLSFFDALIPGRRKAAAWNHYIDYGASEGRSPDGYFWASNYLAANGDLRAAFGNDRGAAALHFFLYGRYEGRMIPGGFDAAGYLARYGDLRAGFDYGPGYSPDLYGAWLHYYQYGVVEGRVFDELFRPDEYLALYADLRAVFGTDRRAALIHWLYFGRYEGRLGRFP
jgi:hypothetical protein